MSQGTLEAKCIFCGLEPLTEEEVWAKWMQPHLPSDQGFHHVSEQHCDGRRWAGFGRMHQRPSNRKSKTMRAIKLRVVCGPCNNGWMSRLQNNAKPILLPLMLAERRTVGVKHQKLLAAWMTMFTMVYERAHPRTAAVSREQRAIFRETNKALPNWQIWVGRYDTPDVLFATHRGMTVIERKASPVVGLDIFRPLNVQITFAPLREICLVALSAPSFLEDRAKLVNAYLKDIGFARIWPARDQQIFIPKCRVATITDASITSIVYYVTQLIGSPSFKLDQWFGISAHQT